MNHTNKLLKVRKFIIILSTQHWQDQSSAETIGKATAILFLMVYITAMEQKQEKWQLYIVTKTIFNLKDENEMQNTFKE